MAKLTTHIYLFKPELIKKRQYHICSQSVVVVSLIVNNILTIGELFFILYSNSKTSTYLWKNYLTNHIKITAHPTADISTTAL